MVRGALALTGFVLVGCIRSVGPSTFVHPVAGDWRPEPDSRVELRVVVQASEDWHGSPLRERGWYRPCVAVEARRLGGPAEIVMAASCDDRAAPFESRAALTRDAESLLARTRLEVSADGHFIALGAAGAWTLGRINPPGTPRVGDRLRVVDTVVPSFTGLMRCEANTSWSESCGVGVVVYEDAWRESPAVVRVITVPLPSPNAPDLGDADREASFVVLAPDAAATTVDDLRAWMTATRGWSPTVLVRPTLPEHPTDTELYELMADAVRARVCPASRGHGELMTKNGLVTTPRSVRHSDGWN